jgi:prephenate dehydrogenase
VSDRPFQRVGIVGLGLIGGSIALRVRELWPDVTLVACDRPEALDVGRRRGIVDRAAAALTALSDVDLVVLAVPVPTICEMMPDLAALGGRIVITDVGSTKRLVMAEAATAGLPRFVGGHPMSGSEQGGIAHARADLFQGRPWMLVESSVGATLGDAARIEEFVRALGGVPHWIDAETHDRVVAYISHVPQLIAVALMNATAEAIGEGGLAASGRAFREMTRLASSPADLWQGILAGNVDNVASALEDVMRCLPSAADLSAGQWIGEAFTRADRARRRLVDGAVQQD